ncbi:hypothetical protein RchiOBHm_Chr1g0350781 [Rosa chinensis]|uniref:DUF4283 domain-containing protein n=1 Tax=Rosa chinensis TaxID=74649 RepID=A0A2P6SG50_ROSCH|nr:hypothetical protein RchiOBHm_Chr1g0350781 [Rosa chinensis]
MVDAFASLMVAFNPSDSACVSLGSTRKTTLQDNHWYMVSRLLGPKARFNGFNGIIPSIWRIKSGLSIHDTRDRFLFQFDREADRNRALHGGPWFYRNNMLVVDDYDDVDSVGAVPLWKMET